jgi:hypothetical protein
MDRYEREEGRNGEIAALAEEVDPQNIIEGPRRRMQVEVELPTVQQLLQVYASPPQSHSSKLKLISLQPYLVFRAKMIISRSNPFEPFSLSEPTHLDMPTLKSRVRKVGEGCLKASTQQRARTIRGSPCLRATERTYLLYDTVAQALRVGSTRPPLHIGASRTVYLPSGMYQGEFLMASTTACLRATERTW